MRKEDRAISVISAFCDNFDRLEWMLAGLARQEFEDFEVVMVNDGGDRAAEELIGKWSALIDVKHVYMEPPTASFRQAAARNLGARHSVGKKLVFLDGDCVAPPDYLSAMDRYISRGVAVYGMRYSVREEDIFPYDGRFDLLEQRAFRNPELAGETFAYTGGFSMGFAVEDYCTVGGANESLIGWGPDDVELWIRLERTGMSKHFMHDEAMIIHLDHPRRPHGDFDRVALLEGAKTSESFVRNGGPLVRDCDQARNRLRRLP